MPDKIEQVNFEFMDKHDLTMYFEAMDNLNTILSSRGKETLFNINSYKQQVSKVAQTCRKFMYYLTQDIETKNEPTIRQLADDIIKI